jgi:hypothetical protein
MPTDLYVYSMLPIKKEEEEEEEDIRMRIKGLREGIAGEGGSVVCQFGFQKTERAYIEDLGIWNAEDELSKLAEKKRKGGTEHRTHPR